MKLRIHGNSLRLRVSESELSRLRWEGRVESWTALGPKQRLTYSIESSPQTDRLAATFECDALTLLIPSQWVEGWTADGTEGFESMQEIDGDQKLHIVVERDLPCRHPQTQDSDRAEEETA